MRRITIILLVLSILLWPSVISASAPQITAKPTGSAVIIDGVKIDFEAYEINDSNYFKLRDLAYALNGSPAQFNVGWDESNDSILLTSGTPYIIAGGEMSGKSAGNKAAAPTNSRIFLDGGPVLLTAYYIDGNNYFMLRDIGKAINFGVDWDGDRDMIIINTGVGYTQPPRSQTGKPKSPAKIEKWIVPPSITADDIQPILEAWVWPLDQWQQVREDPDYFMNVSKIVINGKAGLIDFDGKMRLPAIYKNVLFDWDIVAETFTDWDRWKLGKDYGILEEADIDSGDGERFFAWNFFDGRLYIATHYFTSGPIWTGHPIPVRHMFDEDLTTFDLYEANIGNMEYESEFLSVHNAGLCSGAKSWLYFLHNIDGWYAQPDSKNYFFYATTDHLYDSLKFDKAFAMTEGLAAATRGGKLYYYNADMVTITPDGYDDAGESTYNFTEGLAAVSRGGLWGYIGKNGREIIPCQYEAARPVFERKAWIKTGGLWGVADLTDYVNR